MRLGFISERFESGNAGPGTISNSEGDPGGKSYGIYQLAKLTLMSYRAVAAFNFPGALYDATFDCAWTETAIDYPVEFALDQHLYITKKLYLPNILLAKSLGYYTASRKIQEAVFSIAVQHGKAAKIIKDAYVDNMDVDSQIRKLYEKRSEYVSGLSLSPALKQALQRRYQEEVCEVLNILEFLDE